MAEAKAAAPLRRSLGEKSTTFPIDSNSEFRMFELTQLTHINVHGAEVTHMLVILTLGSTRRYIISHLVKPKFQPYEKKCYKNPFERILPDFNMTSMKFRVRNTSGRMPLHSSGKACTWKPSSSDFRFEAQRPEKKTTCNKTHQTSKA